MAILTGAANPAAEAAPQGRRGPRAALLTAVLFGLAGLGYRIAVLLAGAPPTNSDEGTMGLAALHIAQGRGFPVYFYGQHYMGTVEAYLAAPLVALAGPSVLALRLPNLVLYAAFLAAMWGLTRRLYTPWFATFTVGLLALGSDRILKNQLISGGGYPEINPAGAALLLLACGLALRPRLPGYAVFGLITGLMLWTDWLVLPYVAGAFAVLLLRRPAGRAWAALAAGTVLGAAPLIAHDLTSPIGDSAVATFLGLNGGGPDASWAARLHGGVLVGIPLATGVCAPGRCEPWQLWWAFAWLALLAVAGYGAWRAFRAAGREPGPAQPRAASAAGGAVAPERVRAAGRLALAAAALVSLLVYARSNAAGNTPLESGRYLHCLLVSTPAVLWPLWTLRVRAARVAAVGLAVVMALAATVGVARELPAIAAADDRQVGLLAELDRRGVTLFYTEYWTCGYVAFVSAERVRCAVLDDDLTAGFDRYRPYREAVAAAPAQTFALPTGTAVSRAVRDHLAARGVPYTADVVSGYDIYQPARHVDLPLPR